jgi:phospholipid/cholesterol/gamma-HCH transport system substrate-binding protein
MTNRNFVVGLFVTAGLMLFTVGLFLIGNRHEAFAHHIEYYAEFVDLSGLTKGDKVQVAGMDAGQIVEVGVPTSPAGRFRVKIRINDVLHGLVRTDSIVTVATEGVVGNTFLLIHPGSASAPSAPAEATLTSREPTELADLLDQGKEVLADVDGTVKNANGMLTLVGGNLNSALRKAQSTVANVNDVVVDLKNGHGPAGMLLHDEALADQIRQTVTNAKETSVNLDHVSGRANALMTDVQSRQIPQKIDSTLGSVSSAATNFDATSRKILQTVSEATGPDVRGVSAGVNLRETLSNTNAATANMADDTEALKHNFLFRGFFRHRGYYELTQLSPDEYRKNKLFTSASNERVWLPANKLFEQRADRLEQLSAQGKVLLDSTVAQYGDPFLQASIVIEGYWDRTNTAGQPDRSRSRAILVRRYLQDRYQLDSSHLGVVALQSLPPKGTDRPAWDGVCILTLRTKNR